jgi:hypothetical protein
MYAAVIELRIDPKQASAAAAAFTSQIMPRVRAAEGFIQGYWLDPHEERGLGFVLFDTEQQAKAVMPFGFDWSGPGVTILSAQVRRVAVSLP